MYITFRMTVLAVVVLGVLFLAACGPVPDTEDVSPIGTPPPAASPGAGGDQVVDMTESAREALADHLGVLPESIAVVSVEQVDWPDTSLGCPQEGEMYAQVIVPGSRVVLEVDDEQYTYHTGDERVVLCQDDESTPPAATPWEALDPEVAALIEQAKEELGDRARVAVADITVQSVEAVQWRDSSLGCPKPGMQYLQVITPGYRIVLEADGQVYEYHTDQNGVVYCENPTE